MITHPDMPAAAFADLWRSLKEGRAWSGLVKNRCKDGDFYWVEANAAPYFERGKVMGYTSVRVKPSRAQIAAAERIYSSENIVARISSLRGNGGGAGFYRIRIFT